MSLKGKGLPEKLPDKSFSRYTEDEMAKLEMILRDSLDMTKIYAIIFENCNKYNGVTAK